MPHLRKILVFRSGLLGDTLVGVPALWALRGSFPTAHITYLWQSTGQEGHVSAPDVLDGSGLIDEFRELVIRRNILAQIYDYCRLLWYVLRSGFDLAIILEASHWSRARERFLRLAGIPLVVGPRGNAAMIFRDSAGRLPKVPSIVDELLGLVAQAGITIPGEGCGKMSLPSTATEETAVDDWFERHKLSRTSTLVAVAPGSNMATKRWPTARFAATISSVLEARDIVPVVMGGPTDRDLGDTLINLWGRGVVAAGDLTVREGIELLRRCSLYLGNDTGTMHMAASAGTPCVAIFSSIDMPGRWEPYGSGHIVFRTEVECGGCLLRECVDEGMRCVLSISADDVVAACERVLSQTDAGVA
jgi:ADP-heptose:LPS heptosyltransferase